MVEAYESYAEDGEEEEESRAVSQREGGESCEHAAEEIAGVPEEEGEGDEAGGLEDAGLVGWGEDGCDDLGVDWEGHGYGEGEEDGAGWPEEFAGERTEGDLVFAV